MTRAGQKRQDQKAGKSVVKAGGIFVLARPDLPEDWRGVLGKALASRGQLSETVEDAALVAVLIDESFIMSLERCLNMAESFAGLIQMALKRKKLVVPVLVEPARMKESSALPEELRQLSYRQAIKFKSPQEVNDVAAELLSIRMRGQTTDLQITVPLPAANQVFISYRREDTREWASMIARELELELGLDRVFIDVATRRFGGDYREELDLALARSTDFVLLIGLGFLERDAQGRRRIDDSEDTVRREIETALSARKRFHIVLAGGATLPNREDLPGDIAALCKAKTVQELKQPQRVADCARQLAKAILPAMEKPSIPRSGSDDYTTLLAIDPKQKQARDAEQHLLEEATIALMAYLKKRGWEKDSNEPFDSTYAILTNPRFRQVRFTLVSGHAILEEQRRCAWRLWIPWWKERAVFSVPAAVSGFAPNSRATELLQVAEDPVAYIHENSHRKHSRMMREHVRILNDAITKSRINDEGTLKGFERKNVWSERVKAAVILLLSEHGWLIRWADFACEATHEMHSRLRIRLETRLLHLEVLLQERSRSVLRLGFRKWKRRVVFPFSEASSGVLDTLRLPSKLVEVAVDPKGFLDRVGHKDHTKWQSAMIDSKWLAKKKRWDTDTVETYQRTMRHFSRRVQQAALVTEGAIMCHATKAVFSPSGSQLMMLFPEGKYGHYDLVSNEWDVIRSPARTEYSALGLSRSGLTALGTERGELVILDPAGKPLVESASPHSMRTRRNGIVRIEEISWAPDDSQVALAASDAVWLYDLSETTFSKLAYPKNYIPYIHDKGVDARFTPDGGHLSLCWGGVDTIDLRTGTRRATVQDRLDVQAVSIAVHPRSHIVAIGFEKSRIEIYDLSTFELLYTLVGHEPVEGLLRKVEGLSFSPDGAWLASCGSDLRLVLWDTSTWEPASDAQLSGGSGWIQARPSWSSDSKRLVATTHGACVVMWEVRVQETGGL